MEALGAGRSSKSTIGALIIRIGFWAHCTMLIIRNLENSISDYLGSYIKLLCIIQHTQHIANAHAGRTHEPPNHRSYPRGTIQKIMTMIIITIMVYCSELRDHHHHHDDDGEDDDATTSDNYCYRKMPRQRYVFAKLSHGAVGVEALDEVFVVAE